MKTYLNYKWNEKLSWTCYYIYPELLKILNKNNNKIILDIGCGNGSIANKLIEKGFNVYGIDVSPERIKIVKKKNKNRFFVQDINLGRLPNELKNIKFDTIISIEVIEHLYDPRGFISFCKNILKDKGELILSTPYHGYFKNLLLALTKKMDKHFDVLSDCGHIKFWSKSTLLKILEEYGFKIIDFQGCGRLPYIWKSMLIKAKVKEK